MLSERVIARQPPSCIRPRVNPFLIALALCGALFSGAPGSAEVDGAGDAVAQGTALAQAVYNRSSGKDVSARVVMTLRDSDGDVERRELYSYAKDKGESERWNLLRFVKPAKIDGTGLLTLDFLGDNSDQWIYLPALDRVRRISSSRKGGRFVGSDFYYEDLMDREVSMDRHRLLGEAKVGGAACDLLESVPVDPRNSVYDKRLSCIHKRLLLPLRVDFFKDGSEQPFKRLQARKIKKVQGYWTVFDSTMYDLEKQESTQLLTEKIVYDQGLPDELFTQRGLADVRLSQSYRP